MENPNYSMVWGFIQALAIGFLIGAERESRAGVGKSAVPGLRDFMLIALFGSGAGFLGSPSMVILGAAGVIGLLIIHRLKDQAQHGMTTELAALTTFLLGYMTQQPGASGFALGGAIVVTIILMVKTPITHFVTDVISRSEVFDTIKFLAIVFIVYPLLPQGSFGPYGAFTPRTIWKFVILVSSVSYVGYFLMRFLGESRGLILTGLLGGLVSTTATTSAFARGARESPDHWREYAWAALASNTVQFPRVAVVLYVMNPRLAASALIPLLAMAAAGLLLSLALARVSHGRRSPGSKVVRPLLRNPFALWPAIQFGLIFTFVLFLSRFGSAHFGDRGAFISSLLGGLIDVDAVSISLADLLNSGRLSLKDGVTALLLALLANGVFKTVIAFTRGTWRFGQTVSLGLALMLGVGLLVALATAG
jgi:uncharacterized membrane protein (DUF4010 family)